VLVFRTPGEAPRLLVYGAMVVDIPWFYRLVFARAAPYPRAHLRAAAMHNFRWEGFLIDR
jgi:hypothetical protein